MFLFSLPFTILHHIITYLYPLYASYKAIASRSSTSNGRLVRKSPITGEETTELAELEGWLMYWSVVGVLSIAEGWAEWAWSWLPFYAIVKVAFTLWLVLPQTRGATYLYVNYLGPFLQAHEDDIDVAIDSAKRRAGEAAGNWIATAWQHLRAAILGAAAAPQAGAGTHAPAAVPGPSHAPPTMHDPAAGSASQLFGMLKQYGPLAAAGIVNVMDRAAAAAAGAGANTNLNANSATSGLRSLDEDADSSASPVSSSAAAKRRAGLEQQLKDLEGTSSAGTSSAVAGGGGAAAAAAGARRTASSRAASSKTSNGRLAPMSDPYASSASDLSGDEDSIPVTGRRGRASPQNLDGSYHLVDDDEDDSVVGISQAANTSRGNGWGAWLGGLASPR